MVLIEVMILSEMLVTAATASVNISCTVDHVFPRPSVRLYHGQGQQRLRLKGVTEDLRRYRLTGVTRLNTGVKLV